MPDQTLYVGDLYPPLPLVFSDSNGPLNIAAGSVSSIMPYMDSGTHVVTGTPATNLQVSFTGNFTQGTNQITNVNATTGQLWPPGTAPWATGSTLYAPTYLPAPTGTVGNWSLPTIASIAGTSGNYTLTLSDSIVALASGTGVTIIANMGQAQYIWQAGDTTNAGTFNGIATITWTSGSKPETFAAYSVLISAKP